MANDWETGRLPAKDRILQQTSFDQVGVRDSNLFECRLQLAIV